MNDKSSVIPEFMVRIKLPSSGSYHCSPSGDTEYEETYEKALKDATPVGFSVVRPRLNQRWPVDSEGFTWVRLKCDDPNHAVAFWKDQVERLNWNLNKIRIMVKQLHDDFWKKETNDVS